MKSSIVSPRRAVTVLIVPMLLGALLLGVVAQQNIASANAIEARGSSRDAVVDVAREAAVAFTSYDYRSLDRSFSRLAALATKDFDEQFVQASTQLKPLIAKKKASSTGRVLAVSVLKEPSSTSAAVLVAADATVRNTDVPRGAVQRFRLRIELRQVGGKWLVKEITPVV
jgi:Mce-associated membrane protein